MESISEVKQSRTMNRGYIYHYRRRISEIHASCKWLTNCENGKCPSFVHTGGNYYCIKGELP